MKSSSKNRPLRGAALGLFFVVTMPLVAFSSKTVGSYSEVLIRPRYNTEGYLEITCNNDDVAQKRLIVTALRLEVTTAGYNERSEKIPYFLGWYVNKANPMKELWVGVELVPGATSGMVSLMLPSMLRSQSTLDNEVLLSINTDPPNLGDYFRLTNGNVVYAPVTKVTLEYSDNGLQLLDQVGWEKQGLQKMVWVKSGSNNPLLEAKFSRASRLDTLFTVVGGAFAFLLFGLFATHYVFRAWINRRLVWVLAGAGFIAMTIFLWRIKWVGNTYSFSAVVFGLGVILGAVSKKRLVDTIKQVTSAGT